MKEIATYKYGRLGGDEGLSILCELEEGERVAIMMYHGDSDVAVFKDGKKVCGGGDIAFFASSGLVQIGKGTDAVVGCPASYYLANPLLTAKVHKHLFTHKYTLKDYCHGYHFVKPYPSEKNAMVWFRKVFGVTSLEKLFPKKLWELSNWSRI